MNERVITKADNLPPPLVTLDQLKKDYSPLEQELITLEATEFPPVLEDDEDLGIITKLAVDLTKLRKKIETQRQEASRPILDAQEVTNDYFKRDLHFRAQARQDRVELIAKVYLKKKADREREAREKAAAAALAAAETARQKLAETAAAQTPETGVMPVLRAAEQADALTSFANRTAGAAAASLADVSRTKLDHGTAGLSSFWTFEITDLASIDLNLLRQHVTLPAIEAALRAFIKAGGRNITGVRIYEDQDVNLRGKR